MLNIKGIMIVAKAPSPHFGNVLHPLEEIFNSMIPYMIKFVVIFDTI